jgi:CO/xanthine dehydrogenase Mo-binding subunit
MIRFPLLPESIAVHIIDRPGQPFLGTGECGQAPTAAAISNGIARATGVRLRDMPLRPERIKQAIGV